MWWTSSQGSLGPTPHPPSLSSTGELLRVACLLAHMHARPPDHLFACLPGPRVPFCQLCLTPSVVCQPPAGCYHARLELLGNPVRRTTSTMLSCCPCRAASGLHTCRANAHESEDGRYLHMDAAVYDDPRIVNGLYLERVRAGPEEGEDLPPSYLRRLTIDLQAPEGEAGVVGRVMGLGEVGVVGWVMGSGGAENSVVGGGAGSPSTLQTPTTLRLAHHRACPHKHKQPAGPRRTPPCACCRLGRGALAAAGG